MSTEQNTLWEENLAELPKTCIYCGDTSDTNPCATCLWKYHSEEVDSKPDLAGIPEAPYEKSLLSSGHCPPLTEAEEREMADRQMLSYKDNLPNKGNI